MYYIETTLPNGDKRRVLTNTVLAYSSNDDGNIDTAVDYTPERVNNLTFDGWEVTAGPWSYRIGQPAVGTFTGKDGVLAFGRRSSWLALRVDRFGWLNWSDKVFTQLGNVASYDRANLSAETDTIEGIVTQTIGTWGSIFSGVDLKIYAEGRRLKTELRASQAVRTFAMNNAPAGDSLHLTGLYELDLINIPSVIKAGLLQSLLDIDDEGEHGLEWRDALDRLIAFMPIDKAWIELPNGSTTATYTLRKRIFTQNGRIWLAVGIPKSLLDSAPNGVLVIDPTLDSQPDETAGADTWGWTSNATTNYSTEDDIETANNSTRVGLLRFDDLNGISDSATVSAAVLTLTSKFASSARTNEIHALLVDFVESEATATIRKTSTNWGSLNGQSGSDYNGTAEDSGTLSSTAHTATDFDLLTSTQSFISGTNYGWMIRDGGSTGYGQWWSSGAATSSRRPRLVVTYTVVTTVSDSATADAVLLKVQSNSATADAVLKRTYSDTITNDAVLLKTIAASLGTDAALLKTVTGTSASDATLLKIIAATITNDAVLKKTLVDSLAADSVLMRTQSDTALLDAALLKTQSASTSTDAVLLKTQSGSTTADAIIKKAISAALTSDATLLRTQSNTSLFDAILLKSAAGTALIDSILLETQSDTTALDATILKVGTDLSTLDAILLGTQSAILSFDSVLIATVSDSIPTDAVLLKTQSGALIGYAVLKKTTAGTVTADAVLFRTTASTLSTDAVLLKTLTGTSTLDAYLDAAAGTVTANAAIDAVLLKTAAFTTLIDAVLLRTLANTSLLDAVLLKTISGTMSTAAVLLNTQSYSVDFDAVLNKTLAGSFFADAVMKKASADTLGIDAYIEAEQSDLPAYAVTVVTSNNRTTTTVDSNNTTVNTIDRNNYSRTYASSGDDEL